MIDYIIGEVFRKNGLSTTVLVNGSIGYEIFIPLCYFSKIKIGEKINLEIVHIQKEDGRETLYGFFEYDSKVFFNSLLTVDGIGDKKAFSIFINHEPQEILTMVQNKDIVNLKKVKGVGPKTAEKIIETLAGKIEITQENPVFNDLREALQGLGRTLKEANKFIETLDTSKDYKIQDLIQMALTA